MLAEQVIAPLAHGTGYEVHVSTKLEGGNAPNAQVNPRVTGHGQAFTY
ncbi:MULTISPECIES: hypothetical protein [unclassified Streptomyces]|nr:hypothetical protein OG299_22310 [Streptomyces sp. NBC_01296]WSW60340.1 hypothetical protein OG513_18110 [Streptomyces sp. NBC_00998]